MHRISLRVGCCAPVLMVAPGLRLHHLDEDSLFMDEARHLATPYQDRTVEEIAKILLEFQAEQATTPPATSAP